MPKQVTNISNIPVADAVFAKKIEDILQKHYITPKTELHFKNPYELAVAVMLSAQTTDRKVNQVTPALFERYPTWQELSKASVADVAELIRAVNFYKGKAQRLVQAAQVVIKNFNGELPKSLALLVTIPGIARKSANVILQELWDIAEGIVVDTHITRVSQLLGLTKHSDPKKIEQDLMKLLPKDTWRHFSGAVVLHGRYVCIARRPKCQECVLKKLCPSASV